MLETVVTSSMALVGKAVINHGTKNALDLLVKKIKEQKWKHGSEIGKSIYNDIVDNDKTYLKYIDICISKYLFSYTILDPEQKKNLSDIYHPIKIKKVVKDSESKMVLINDDFFINDKNITNISGTAGQGKSTILRKILINHIEHGEKLPFFLNLSTIQHESIKSELLNLMERIGLSLDEKKMDALLKSEKIIVFLDGFDELPIAKRDGILKEVMKLNEDFSLQLITTSRPDTKICDTAGIIQYKVSSLDFSDILEIVKKSGVNLDIKAVERSLSLNRRFADSLNTPILVVLFIKCFPFMNIIPNDTIDFYKSIFDVMYETHDKAKRFLDRDKRIKDITRTVSYDFFCALCFVSLFDEITSFSEKQLEDKLMEAMELVDPEFIKRGVSQRKYANDFMHDLIDITSLIAKDSDDSYIYSHKSIQEFHAAEFIKNQPSSNNAKLEYCQIITRSLLDSEIMLSAIDFLTKIDKTDSINYILKPYCESLNFEVQGGDIIASNEALDNYIDHQFKDTFIAFMPKGKFGDVRDMGIEHITKASKKDGRVIIGPTSEFLPIFNVFSINLKDDYISDLINKIAISKSTINYLMTKNKFEKMPIVVYFKNLSEGEKQEIRSNIRIKINDFCRVYFKDEYNKITKKRTTFMERYKK